MLTVLGFLVVTFALAFLAESVTEYVFPDILDHIPGGAKARWLLRYVALAVGIGFAFNWGVDLVYLLGGFVDSMLPDTATPLNIQVSVLGIIVTGYGIGRGADYLHQFVRRFFKNPADVETA